MPMVAEGGKTASQRIFLDGRGGDQLQGSHSNPPLDAQSFADAYCRAAGLPAASEEMAINA